MYKLNKDAITGQVSSITKTEEGLITCFPFNPDNTDYQAYLAWVALGNTPQPADEVTK